MKDDKDFKKADKTEIVRMASRRDFLFAAAATSGLLLAPTNVANAQVSTAIPDPQRADNTLSRQFPNVDLYELWKKQSFSIDRWWGEFSRELPNQMDMFADNPWAIGPFTKFSGNPVLAPTPAAWDQGAFSGGVHNGAILVKDNIFYYVYRGHRPIDIPQVSNVNYLCDIGVATSTDGIHFKKDYQHSPFFRKGDDRKYSYEDVNVVKYKDTYYLFCNQWLWGDQQDTRINGIFLATSKDLLNWEKVGIVFPNATETHRNGVVLQNPHNEAVRVNGKFVMYINHGFVAYSTDMVHWESHKNPNHWPGGEGCFALADYDPTKPDDMVHFSGGPHTGHYYAIGEVHLSKADPEKPLGWLPRSPLFAETKYPFENGFSAEAPHNPVSTHADCIFFTGLTQHDGRWWIYYGAADYYTCLATAPVRHLARS